MQDDQNGAGQSAAERLAWEIREAIYEGNLVPGSPLREVSLADAKGVSRRTVREALLLLASQGLVVHERNRGATVRALGADDVIDMYRVRRTFELQGARNAPLASDEDRARLQAAYERLHDAVHGEDSREIVNADLSFHGAVVGLVGSARLDGFYAQMSPEMEMVLAVIRRGERIDGLTPEQIIADHRTIHAALMARDVIEAQRAILEHIDFNERYLLGLLESTRLLD